MPVAIEAVRKLDYRTASEFDRICLSTFRNAAVASTGAIPNRTDSSPANLQVRKGAKRSAPPLKPQRSWVDTPKEKKGRDLS